MLRNLLMVSDDELAFTTEGEAASTAPQWMAKLKLDCTEWLKLLPEVSFSPSQ